MGVGVFGLMQAAAWGYRLPASRVYQPSGAAAAQAAATPAVEAEASEAAEVEGGEKVADKAAEKFSAPVVTDVTLQAAMATPNMYLLFAGSVGVVRTSHRHRNCASLASQLSPDRDGGACPRGGKGPRGGTGL